MQRFELDAIIHIIHTNAFRTVVLQFPDDELQYSIEVHDYLQGRLEDSVTCDTTEEVTASVDLFIAADSTWGSSIDDVSAMHCGCDVLVYFGTDLSSSGKYVWAVDYARSRLTLCSLFRQYTCGDSAAFKAL